jgi:hypothetical protein
MASRQLDIAINPLPTFCAFARDKHPPGVIFARCNVVGHLEATGGAGGYRYSLDTPHECLSYDLRWWMGGYALVLADVEPTPLVPARGMLGLWRPTADVLAQLPAEEPR